MEVDPFPISDFDHWASNYDRSVKDEAHFPFIGYREVLKAVVRGAAPQPGMCLLDVGAGTGNLAELFIRQDCSVWAIDFSPAMLTELQRKLPQVTCVQSDIRMGWPAELPPAFDRIVSAYVFHHFALSDKVQLCSQFIEHLVHHGRLVLADIAFNSRARMVEFQRSAMDEWEEEFYWIAEETLPAFNKAGLQATYTPVSVCAGLFTIEKP
jgi:putative AdoMet-dependent methyltransferase